MFWKKSNKKDGNSNKLFSIPKELRGAFRVTPSPSAPLKATLDEKPILILNLSSGGLCCKEIDLDVGNIYSLEVFLPPENKKISVSVEILPNDEANHCRCRFLDLSLEFEDLIHLYVLNRQKEEQENYKKMLSEKNTEV